MSVAPQIISQPPGSPQGTVQAIADLERIINNLSVNASNLFPGGTPGDRLVARSVTADRLVAHSITAGEIQANTITATEIAAGTITAGQIQAGTITSTEIANGTVTGGDIATTTITGGNIVTGTITATQIAATSIDASRLNVGTLSAITGSMGTLSSGVISLAGGTVVISDSLGITINAGSGGINNITWLSGAQEVGKLSLNTISTTSFGSLETRSPNGTQFAALVIDADDTGGGILQEVKVNTSGAGPATLLCSAGYGQWPKGIGMFGATPPGTKPATPASVADVAAILQGYGMCV